MSWDILIMDVPRARKLISDLPIDFAPPPLGDRATVIERIRLAAPMANFADPAWGVIETDTFSIEVNVGVADPVGSVMVHVRGGGGSVGLIADMLERLGVGALDIQTGEMFDSAAAGESLATWRAFRDQVVNTTD